MPLVLGQVVGDGEPGRLGADEDVMGGPDGRLVRQPTHRDVDVLAVADQRIEEGTAAPAVGVVRLRDVLAVDQQPVLPLGDGKFAPLDAGKGLEGRAGGAPAPRAVAIHGVLEFVRHRIVDGAAVAPAGERFGHGLSPFPGDSLYTGAMTKLDGVPGPTSRHFISQRLRMHYVDWGNPDPPPLLLV